MVDTLHTLAGSTIEELYDSNAVEYTENQSIEDIHPTELGRLSCVAANQESTRIVHGACV